MKTLPELLHFYETELQTDLNMLELERKVLKRQILAHWLIGLPVGIGISAIAAMINPVAGLVVGILSLVVIIIVYYTRFGKRTKAYKEAFKTKVIGRIINFIDPGLQYNHAAFISKAEYSASEIFQNSADRYNGDDLVHGALDKTGFQFSELHTQDRRTDSKGRTYYVTIFKGLFFIADFNKDFKGKTFVLPDSAESTFGAIGKWFQKINISRPSLVTLEDPEFEKAFVCYSSDQVEARYILSTSLMQRILNYKNKTGHKLHFAFLHSKLYAAIPISRNLFETGIFSSKFAFKDIEQYFDDLMLAIGMIEDFNLNLRIWTKE